MGPRTTIHEVARLAGVSTATVSRVLSGSRPVTESTAAAVRAAATRLGYHVDPVGQSLRRRQTRTIGLVVPDVTNPFFGALIRAVDHAARAVGHGVVIADADNSPTAELESVERLLNRRIDALLIVPCDRTRSRPAVLKASGEVPTVQIDRSASRAVHYVGLDNEAGIAQLLESLASGGRQAFAFVGSDPHVSTTWERQRAFVRLVPQYDSHAPRVLTGDFSHGWGMSAAREIIDRWPETDAVVCASDLIALGVIEGLARMPDAGSRSVAVTGFDDTPFSTLKDPEVTTVRQPLDEMAASALALIPTIGGGHDRPARMRFSPVFVARASSL